MTGPLVIAAETQLNDKLKVDLLNNRKVLARSGNGSTLPGEPLLVLADEHLLPRLRDIFELDRMSPHLRFITTPKSSHVFPIHFQPARGHQVTPNEFHNLHLVWYQGCIFVKPIPPYLFSAAFWEWITEADPDIFKAAAGFMRSYTFLIRSETDYRLANDEKVPLLPFGMENTTDGFERFSRFINQFSQLTDDQVSPRYSYGELRLRRLNWLIRILGIKVTYFHMHGEWGTVFMDMLAPLVAIFAVLSIFLAAMQVGLAADPSISEAPARTYAVVCYWFSVVVLLATGTASLGFLGLMVGVYILLWFISTRLHEECKSGWLRRVWDIPCANVGLRSPTCQSPTCPVRGATLTL